MADYKHGIISGEKWRRFSKIVIENPRLGAPSILCVEQEVISITEREHEVIREVGNLGFPFDPEMTFEIINPLTNEGTGQFSNGAQVYALVYSYVMTEAAKRDVTVGDNVIELIPEI